MNKYYSILFLLHLYIITLLEAKDAIYFQQEVRYEIDVRLNDNIHTLSGFEKIEYINNSPDTLSFIWFHIWPNAYKNDSTAYAKQAGPNSRFAKSDSLSRGFIDSLNLIIIVTTQPEFGEIHPVEKR